MTKSQVLRASGSIRVLELAHLATRGTFEHEIRFSSAGKKCVPCTKFLHPSIQSGWLVALERRVEMFRH